MTNAEIKLVVKAVCFCLGSDDRHYSVKVDDNGIEVEYVAAEVVDRESDPQLQQEPKVELGHFNLPLITVLNELVAAVDNEIQEVESVEIEYKKF